MAVAVAACCATRFGLLLLLCTRLLTNWKGLKPCPVSPPAGATAIAVPSEISIIRNTTEALITQRRPFGGRTIPGPFLPVPRMTIGWRKDVVYCEMEWARHLSVHPV